MTTFENEQWLPVIGFEGRYEISSYGRVKSLGRWINPNSKQKAYYIAEKMLKLNKDTRGYLFVMCSKNSQTKRMYVHQAIAHSFIGSQEKGIEVRHLDGNKLNNTLENITYGTKSDNMRDAVRHGTLVFSRSKLTREDVINIGKDPRTHATIAKDYGICETTVSNIKRGASFKGFTEEIVRSRQKRILSPEEMELVLDTTQPRKDIADKLNLTLPQVKRVRRNQNPVVWC